MTDISDDELRAKWAAIDRMLLVGGLAQAVDNFKAGKPFWQAHSGPRATGWHYKAADETIHGPFATRAEAEQHAKDSAP